MITEVKENPSCALPAMELPSLSPYVTCIPPDNRGLPPCQTGGLAALAFLVWLKRRKRPIFQAPVKEPNSTRAQGRVGGLPPAPAAVRRQRRETGRRNEPPGTSRAHKAALGVQEPRQPKRDCRMRLRGTRSNPYLSRASVIPRARFR